MIPSNQLQIGSYFINHAGEMVRATAVEVALVFQIENGEADNFDLANNMMPVVITDTMLLQLGFTQHLDKFSQENGFVLKRSDNEGQYDVIGFHRQSIAYLHELQLCYKASTEKELYL